MGVLIESLTSERSNENSSSYPNSSLCENAVIRLFDSASSWWALYRLWNASLPEAAATTGSLRGLTPSTKFLVDID